jgi:hypothetical protein
MNTFKLVRWRSCSAVALVILFTRIASAYAAAPTVSDSGSVSQKTLSETSLLQFNAGGHILGFKPDKVYFASLDHAIVEEFLGTKGVMPVGEAGQGSTEVKKGAPGLGKVIYKNLWRGITLTYEAKNSEIAESTYVLGPGADVTSIKLKYNVSVGIEKDGSLRFRHPSDKGYFSQSAPKAWQEISGKRTHIEVAFADYGDNTIGFRLGEHDRQYPVVIDPTYQWHTFYGGAGNDYGNGIAVDTSGNVYVTGSSTATWNGPGATPALNPYSGSSDIVVLKLNSAGAYQWHTFFGSVAGSDTGLAIAVESISGNVYVTGYSIAAWNGPGATAPLNPYNGSNDVVVLKLNNAGAYQWHTFYGAGAGGGNNDYGRSLSMDSGGNVYVTGNSNAAWNGPGATAPLNPFSGNNEIVVLKLNSAGAYQWHTFYGGAGNDYGRGIAVDSISGNVYVAGDSTATWNGPGATAPLNPYTGNHDIVVLKLNSAGAYQWHTFFGSVAGWDEGYSVAVDSISGNVYVAGDSDATWNGPGATAPLNPYSGAADIVVLKLNSAGAYQWHTFYGSVAGNDYDNGIAVDSGGNVYVSAYSYAGWNAGVTAPLNAYSGASDIVVLKLNTSGVYQWHTFYGSAGTDVGYGIAVDSGGNVYLTGNGNATWNAGVTAPLNAHSANYDIVVLKLAPARPTITTTSPLTNITSVTATAGGNVTSDGGTAVTARGTCYSTSANPTTPCTSDGTGTGSFTSSLTGLTPNTPYHVRAYATNSEGTAYGSDVPLTTLIEQTITFTNPGSKTLGAAPFALSASGGASGNPVTFASQTSSVCSVSGNTATLVAAGTCTITADQAGNASYAAAAQVVQSFTVNALIAQTVNFTNPGSRTVGAAPFALSASGGASGNPVTFASQTNSVCTVSGSTATLVAAGTCTITADQAGNANYAAAPQVVQSFTVNAVLAAVAAIPSLSELGLLTLAALVGLLGMALTKR